MRRSFESLRQDVNQIADIVLVMNDPKDVD